MTELKSTCLAATLLTGWRTGLATTELNWNWNWTELVRQWLNFGFAEIPGSTDKMLLHGAILGGKNLKGETGKYDSI